ncbi:uncharacterized protein LOC135152753 [Daucus carota subsp. sativus]|uniref:uncharacterized protein LOC135152753 n=1 Tax=Daucus carota subsp. sativus TaxID=79200 RepID=UPI003082DF2D
MGDRPPVANDTKALKAFYEPKINDIQSSIVRPAIEANTFEIKPSTIQMVQNSVHFGASGGALLTKSYDEAYELIEMMAANEYQNPTQRLHQGKAAGILDVDATTALTAQLKALTMKVDSLIANALINRPQGTLPSDTEANPGKREVKEQVQAVTLRSGKVTKDKDSATEQSKEESDPQVETPVLSPKSDSEKTVFDADKNEINEEASKKSAEKSSPKADIGVKQVYPPPPFPKGLQKHKLDKQFAKFLEVFKKLHINIPFVEALEQMPSYAKFMKGILSRKLKLEDLETVALTEECSAVLQQKLPPKLKDPGSFTIPCTIGPLSFDKCLCDLGASINLMPLSVFKKLGLPEPKPTNMYLQLADRSITYSRGIVEDVLVKVDKLIFPANFVFLDFEEDKKIPIILGRPFLATGQTLIDVQKGELTMRVQDQSVTFKVFNAMKFPTDEEECFKVEPLEAVEKVPRRRLKDGFEVKGWRKRCKNQASEEGEKGKAISEFLDPAQMGSPPHLRGLHPILKKKSLPKWGLHPTDGVSTPLQQKKGLPRRGLHPTDGVSTPLTGSPPHSDGRKSPNCLFLIRLKARSLWDLNQSSRAK